MFGFFALEATHSFSFPLHVASLICPLALCASAVLDVYVLSTDGQVQDFKFPQSSKGGVSIQLSANTVKLNSRNGEFVQTERKKETNFWQVKDQ